MFIDLRERERERETSIGYLPYVPQPRIEPTTFLVYDMILQPIELLGQGQKVLIQKKMHYWETIYIYIFLCYAFRISNSK